MSNPHINYNDPDPPNNTHCSNNTHSFNNLSNNFFNNDFAWNVNIGATDERSKILAWLSPLEPRIRHQEIRTGRADSVGEWLLQTNEFRRWYDGAEGDGPERATLFCCGDPAVGKTYFSSLVVDRLCDKVKDKAISIACFYVDSAAGGEQSPTNMLGSLLKQIVGGLERIPDEISQTFQHFRKVIGGRGLRVPEIVKMLQMVTSLRPTFICVDALDEYVEGQLSEVLDSLRQVVEKSPSTRIFLTGRRYIQSKVEGHLRGRAAVLFIKPNKDDILEYVRTRLSEHTSLKKLDSGLEAEIIKSFTENVPETFLLISLTVDAILQETTASGRRERLRVMMDGSELNGVYDKTLERIKKQGGEKARLGMRALMWLSHSERLLQLDELLHALAVEIGSTDLNPGNIPPMETLLSCCFGLVAFDGETSNVRLVHSTLREYLGKCPIFGAAHSIMAETCLTYLNFQIIKEISPAFPRPAPLLKYSSLYWGIHARKEVSQEASKNVVSLALKLFGQIESHISTKLLLVDVLSKTGRYSRDIPINDHLIGFTGLHCASVFGISKIATTLMGQPNCDLNKRDFLGITPLIWAAICGQEGIAMLLLERQIVIPDKPDKFSRRTALSWAARNGHEGVVKILLGRASTNPDGTDGWWGKTPRVMNKVLGKRYVNPSRPDKYGQTPISLAAEEGHEAVVELLLRRKDVKPDTADGYGRTPLLCASSKGRERAVELLLERGDISIHRADTNGETPLLSAAEGGYEGVVNLLLGRIDINPNTPGKTGQTPLSRASGMGHGGVVELLLKRQDVNPNIPDDSTQTPLSWAAEKGRDEVVKLLLGRGDVNPNIPDKDGKTPLSWAVVNGHDGVVGLLLEREDVSPNTPSKSGSTPLSWAARIGRNRAVELLLGREDVNPDLPDNDGGTPLSWAAAKGRDGVVGLLLARQDVNPNIPSNSGRTPLSWAARNGRAGVVKLLLGREDVDPNISDKDDKTPLSWAAVNGHDGVVGLLLERGDVSPNTPSKSGSTPILWAARNGRDGAVKLLLERKDVDPNMPDNGGGAPLSWAAANGCDGIVTLLLRREDVNPNMPSSSGSTPLSWAARNGRDRAVELLLGREDVDPNMPDNDGKMPLLWAAENCHTGVVKLLQAHTSTSPSRINPNSMKSIPLNSPNHYATLPHT